MIIYKYQIEHLERSVYDYLLIAHTKRLNINLICEDPEYWDEILWNRGFLPHGTGESKYQKITITKEPREGALQVRVCQSNWVFSGKIVFIPVTCNDSQLAGCKTYMQDIKGKWSLAASPD